MKHYLTKVAFIVSGLWLSACSNVGVPEGIEPVENFQLERYLGQWYEIARLDHTFERGLDRVTAEYQMRDDGGVHVINRGYNTEKGSWEKAEGKAYFVGEPTVGELKVSFFGPFYGGYNIFELHSNYEYAMVAGPDRTYFWILAREPQMDPQLLEELVAKAEALGFPTEELIFPEHPEP